MFSRVWIINYPITSLCFLSLTFLHTLLYHNFLGSFFPSLNVFLLRSSRQQMSQSIWLDGQHSKNMPGTKVRLIILIWKSMRMCLCKWLSISLTPEFPLTECMSNWPIVQKGIVGNFYDISKWCQPLQLAAVATDPWSEVLNKHPSPWPRSRSTGPYIPILIWQPPPPPPLLSSDSVPRRGEARILIK